MKVLGSALLFLSLVYWANGFNITKMLNAHPEYSKFNHLLSETKLADEINSRQTITVLAISNANMGSLSGMPLAAVKRALSLHIVLDYFDAQKLHAITNGTALTTTLYQTTGNAPGNTGFVNITDLKGGKVGFGPAAKGSKLDSTYVKSVKHEGYNISIIEVSKPIMAVVAEAPAPMPTEVNITAILFKEGCKIFAGLLSTTGALKTYEDAVAGGLTVFAPTDTAFSGLMKKVDNFTSDDKQSLILFHALPTYSPLGTLKTTNGPIGTLATSSGHKFAMTVSSSGDTVILNTGINKATISGTAVDDQPLAIFTVNQVLRPKELFTLAPAPAPAPVPVAEPVLAPEAEAPVVSSPPAPAGPAEEPSAENESESPSASTKAEKSYAVASYVARAWSLMLCGVVASGALIL